MAPEEACIGRRFPQEAFQHDRIMFCVPGTRRRAERRPYEKSACVNGARDEGTCPLSPFERIGSSFVSPEEPETGVNCQLLERASASSERTREDALLCGPCRRTASYRECEHNVFVRNAAIA